MKPGQLLTAWWQKYVLGAFNNPQDLYTAALAEIPDQAQASQRFLDVPTDGDTWQAPERLKAPRHFLSEGYLRQSGKCDWQFTDRRLMRWAALYIELARKRGIPLYVHCATRTEAEQANANFAGNSKASYPNSAHNIGEAVDIVHGVYHWNLTVQEWQLLYVLGRLALDRINATLPTKPSVHAPFPDARR